MASKWEEFKVADKVKAILKDVQPNVEYGTGRPFMTTYQIASQFWKRFPNEASAISSSPGGEGEGNKALTIYLARELATRIKNVTLTNIELRFLDHTDLISITVNFGAYDAETTTNQAGFPFTMFRLIDSEAGNKSSNIV